MAQILFIGLIALLLGLAFCFAGYRFFRLLMPFWGFFVGFGLGAQIVASLFGGHFLATILGWIIGIIVGLIFAALAYTFFTLAVAILGASVGYWIGTGAMSALGYSHNGFLTVLVGVIVAIALAILIIALNLPKFLIIFSTALGGASTILTGVLLLLGRISIAELQYGAIAAFVRSSTFWTAVWLILAIAGIITQLNKTQKYTLNPAKSANSRP